MKKFVLCGITMVISWCLLLSCSDENPIQIFSENIVPSENTPVTSFTASVSGTFNEIDKIDLALGKRGVLYSVKSDGAEGMFMAWLDGSENPGCLISDRSTVTGETVQCILDGLIEDTEYDYCLFLEKKDGKREISHINTFRTKAFNPDIKELSLEEIQCFVAFAKGELNIDEKDAVYCEVGVLVSAQRNININNSTLYGYDNTDQKARLSGLESNKDYYCRMYVKYPSSTGQSGYVYGPEKGFKTKDIKDVTVDLGLSVLWASYNLGAEKPEDSGDYFAWGEVNPKESYTWSTYKWSNKSYNSQTKYNTNKDYGKVDNNPILDLEDDVAHYRWDGNWRMPTFIELTELMQNCSWTWTTQNGVNGFLVTSRIPGFTDRSIFLPAAGARYNKTLYNKGLKGNYWSSSVHTYYSYTAYDLYMDYDEEDDSYHYIGMGYYNRDEALTVRPVCPSERWISSVSIEKNSVNKTLLVNDNASLGITVRQNDKEWDTPTFIWSSDNLSVATVDENGVVTGKSAGTAHITASLQSLSVQYVVTVVAESDVEPEFVDMGLSVNWATFNVGALVPEDYGSYYAWGEVEPKNVYYWDTYKFRASGDSEENIILKKYNSSSIHGTVDNKRTLDPEDDVAHVKWGGNWRMPTKAEQEELSTYSTYTWTTLNGVKGILITSTKPGYTDKSIFLPAAGYRNSNLYSSGSYGCYWSSSLNTQGMSRAWASEIYPSNMYLFVEALSWGQTVRPVCPSEEWLSSAEISISKDDKTILVDGNFALTANVKQKGEDLNGYPVMWTSDNTAVAVVDENGVVIGITPGTAHITASVQSLSAQCTVTVLEESAVEKQFVDLGLSVKWATFNVGASSPEDYGAYFAWGEVETRTDYSLENYKFRKSGYYYRNIKFNKYVTISKYGKVDNKIVLEPEDDVAHVKWGGDWRMPTQSEIDELRNDCTWSWTTMNGVEGFLVRSNIQGFKDRTIFIPAAGVRSGRFISMNTYYGDYWSSSLDTDYPISAWDLDIDYWGPWSDGGDRSNGLPVRPVCPK